MIGLVAVLGLVLLAQLEPPGVRLQDEGVAKGTIDTLNCVGAGIACTRAGRKGTLTVSGGGTGSPGGSSGQVQWNNAAAFDGTARVTTDGNDLMLSGQTTVPTGVAGKLTPLAYGLFGPAMPAWAQGDLGFGPAWTPAGLDARQPVWACLSPVGAGITVSNTTGPSSSLSGGTLGSVSWASTDARTRSRWQQFTTSPLANSSGFQSINVAAFWRGNAAGLGGFWVHGQTAVAGTPNATQRFFAGITGAALSASADPSAATNTAGFACDAGATTLSVISNDNAGTATVAKALSANFPCTTTGIGYDWWIWAAPNASTISWAIREIVGGFTDSGVISSDLPQNTVLLGWIQWINTGSTASAVVIHAGATCFVASP